jgi:cytochrome c-type biogenesis protein CcmH/NrfF
MTKRRKFTALLLWSWAALAGGPIGVAAAQSENVGGVSASEPVKKIGGKFMCMCSCNQVLTQCNHVGCTVSTAMLKEIDQHLAKGDSEAAITQGFVQEFGTQVYAEPPKSGLSLVAWTLPSVYLIAGTVLVIVIAMRWRAKSGVHEAYATPAPAMSPDSLEQVRRRIARETED